MFFPLTNVFSQDVNLRHLNDRHSVTIGKQRNPFPAEASTRTSPGENTMLPRPLNSLESLLYDQLLWFFHEQTDRTLVYDKHLNDRHSVTLRKHWNPFSAGALLRILLGKFTTLPRPASWLERGKPPPHSTSPRPQRLRHLGLGASNSLPHPNFAPSTCLLDPRLIL